MELRAAFTKTFAGGAAIHAELTLDTSPVTVLFGESGCGKTTVLRCLAGLEHPEEGRIEWNGEVWLDTATERELPSRARRIGCVFQEGALFPHLDVAGNIAFGLRRLGRGERRERVRALVRLAGLDGLEHRRPGQLSGGQRQRVALARALAPEPRLLLLDEPFASLDRPAQEGLRARLRAILRETGVPAILVTHDRTEALALGDRLLLMQGGRIRQAGSPEEVFSRPQDPEMARILGIGTVLEARVEGRREGLLRLGVGAAQLYAPDPGGAQDRVYACIRGEGVSLEREAPGTVTQRNRLPAVVLGVEPLGALVRVRLDAGFPLEALITTWAAEDLRLEAGSRVFALVKATAVHVIPRA